MWHWLCLEAIVKDNSTMPPKIEPEEDSPLWPFVKTTIIVCTVIGSVAFLACYAVSLIFGWPLQDVCMFVFDMVRRH